MRVIRRAAVAVLSGLLLVGCTAPTDGSQAAQPVISALPRALSGDEQIAATATTDFGLGLFRSVNARTGRDENLALSPISASLALGLLLNGAEGQTFDQVRSTLGFADRPLTQVNAAYKSLIPLLSTLDPSVKMAFANSTWFDLAWPPSANYRQSVTDAFGAKVTSLSFQAPSTVTTINDWVSAATNTRIPKIIESFDPGEIAMLINATYFKGRWRSQFNVQDTRSEPFRVTSSQTLSVPTMHAQHGLVRSAGRSDGTVIGELPYGGDAFVMDIVLPPIGTIETFVDSLTPSRWRALVALLPDSSSSQLIQLPKYRLETERLLNDGLISLGMTRAFANAQLNPMFVSPSADLAVGRVIQKVFVDVNEEGTEAAAVTAIGIVTTSLGPAGFIVDRPFLFVIRDRLTGTILFIGKVVRPEAP